MGSDYPLPPDFPELFIATVGKIAAHEQGAVLELSSPGENARKIEILYPFPTVVPFLTLRLRWTAISRWIGDVKAGDTVTIRPMDSDGTLTVYTGNVLAVNPLVEENPDLAVSVDWGEEAGCISPWEVITRNGQPVQYPDSSTLVAQYIGDFTVALKKVLDDPKNANVVHLPVTSGIGVPCSLYMIHERIENAWYRKFPGVFADLKLTAKTNIAAFGTDAPEAEATRKLCAALSEQLQKLVEQAKNKRRPRKS
jgi:hypothetical protein